MSENTPYDPQPNTAGSMNLGWGPGKNVLMTPVLRSVMGFEGDKPTYGSANLIAWDTLSEDQKARREEWLRQLHIQAETEKRHKMQKTIKIMAAAIVGGAAIAAAGGAAAGAGATTSSTGAGTVAALAPNYSIAPIAATGTAAGTGVSIAPLAAGAGAAVPAATAAGGGVAALAPATTIAPIAGAGAAIPTIAPVAGSAAGTVTVGSSAATYGGLSAGQWTKLGTKAAGAAYSAYENSKANKAYAEYLKSESSARSAYEAERIERLRNGPLAKIAPFLMRDALGIYGQNAGKETAGGVGVEELKRIMGLDESLNAMPAFNGWFEGQGNS